jgi:hypothetical protein
MKLRCRFRLRTLMIAVAGLALASWCWLISTRTPTSTAVIQPADFLEIEAKPTLPGRPIFGERLVRPDGKITLGFYGEVSVADLSEAEAKDKIALHLYEFLKGANLGAARMEWRRTGSPEIMRRPELSVIQVSVSIRH